MKDLFDDDPRVWIHEVFFLMFSAVLLVNATPERSSSRNIIRPGCKHICHSKTFVRFLERSPNTRQRISIDTVVDLQRIRSIFNAGKLREFVTDRKDYRTVSAQRWNNWTQVESVEQIDSVTWVPINVSCTGIIRGTV